MLLVGILVWMVVQGYFVSTTVHEKALPPEPKDALTYIVKSRQLEECPRQDCLAIQDLRKQFYVASSTPEEAAERWQAGSKIFPVYHPFLSAIFIGLTKFGMGLVEAHNWVWTAAPVLFGLAFAYLLSALWGPAAAGIALILLSFTVFPDTGLHHVVPSNLAMAIGCIVWARIITKRGDAPWATVAGAFILVTMHPMGRLYTVIAVLTAAVVSDFRLRSRTWLALGLAFSMLWLPRLLRWLTDIQGLVVSTPLFVHGKSWLDLLQEELAGTAATILQVCVEVVRLQDSLFGHFALFFGAVAIGFIAAPPERRSIALRVTVLYFCFFLLALFVVSTHPADIVLRMWTPLVVILQGAVGYGVCEMWSRSAKSLAAGTGRRGGGIHFTAELAWPLVLLAVLSGYVCQRGVLGSEQIISMRQYVINRQPLKLCPSQPALLMSEAKPGDRVLYTSVIVMPYYFVHEAMKLGAVYYHPALESFLSGTGWLTRPDLRFAVTYNPTVYRPEFAGTREIDWWISMPDFRFSPLSTPKTAQPLSREGVLRSTDFSYLDIEPADPSSARKFRLHVKNSGGASTLEVNPLGRDGEPVPASAVKIVIKADWTDWIDLDFTSVPEAKRFRLVFPTGASRGYGIDAIVFGPETNLHWPWNERAAVIFMPRDCCAGPIRVSFDPVNLLPEPLRQRKVTVLDDCGSSVLLEIAR
ncbi:MAG: hypothetical protein HY914_09380 [Desulfomonile tiedjei]|nr:hypothetical protein [Desulfomonile tiedjei]